MATFTNVIETRPARGRAARVSPHRRLLNGEVSGRRRAHARREMGAYSEENRPTSLLDEARRRMKSNMQANVALLRLCPEGGDHHSAEAALAEMENRLQSMAALHRALCRSGSFDQIDLAVLLRQSAVLFNSPPSSPLAGGWVVDAREGSLVWSSRDDGSPAGSDRFMDLEAALALLPAGSQDPARRAVYACVIAVPPSIFRWRSPRSDPPGRGPRAGNGEVGIRLRPAEDGVIVELTLSDCGPGLPEVFELKAQRALGLEFMSVLARLVQGSMGNGSASAAAFEVAFIPSREMPVRP